MNLAFLSRGRAASPSLRHAQFYIPRHSRFSTTWREAVPGLHTSTDSPGPVSDSTVYLRPFLDPHKDGDKLKNALTAFGPLAYFGITADINSARADFASPDDARVFLEAHGPDSATPFVFQKRKLPIKSGALHHPPSKILRVFQLPMHTTEAEVRAWFKQHDFSPIKKVTMMGSNDRKQVQGPVALVEMDSMDTAIIVMAKFRRFKLNASGIGELPLSMGFPPPHIGTAIDANTTTPPISEIKSHPLPASEAKPNASPPYEVKTSAGPVTEATVFLKPLVNPEQDADELRKALSTFGELAHFRVSIQHRRVRADFETVHLARAFMLSHGPDSPARGFKFKGRQLAVESGSSPKSGIPSKTLYMYQLSPQVTQPEIIAWFEKHQLGPIKRIAMDTKHKESSMAYVVFHSIEASSKVIDAVHRLKLFAPGLDNRPMRVKFAKDKEHAKKTAGSLPPSAAAYSKPPEETPRTVQTPNKTVEETAPKKIPSPVFYNLPKSSSREV